MTTVRIMQNPHMNTVVALFASGEQGHSLIWDQAKTNCRS